PGNAGGAYRATDVDLEASSLGGYDVGWTTAGEWIVYSVNVASNGSYVLQFKGASPSGGGKFHATIAGANTAPLTGPNTGGWQNWTTISSPVLTLGGGPQQLTLVVDADGFNIAAITAASVSTPTSTPPPPPTTLPPQPTPGPTSGAP